MSPRTKRLAITGAIIAVVAGATIAVATRETGSSSASVRTTKSASPGLQFDAKAAGSKPTLTAPPLPGARSAADPAGAVRQFLDAEVAKAYDASFAVLADDDRAAAAPEKLWAANHVNLPLYTGYRLVGAPTVAADGATATVVVDVDARPSIDPVAGLRPAHAKVSFATVHVADGWRVALRRSTSQPVWADESGAAPAAVAWATSAQGCHPTGQYEGGLLGVPKLGKDLCGTSGGFTAGTPQPLSSVGNPAPVVNQFGPDANGWARVVRLDGPATLRAVLAPVGDTWVVVGVVPA